jgi:hypothetical protein
MEHSGINLKQQTMNYIKHLTGFFEKVALDRTLNPTHISLYIALFQFWNCNRFKNPISINRDEVMRISKISSKATYHKCLKNLHSLGYINYQPSYNPFRGSHVVLFNFSDDLKPAPKSERKPNNEPVFEQINEQALNKLYTSSEPGSKQAIVPSINNTNNLNEINVANQKQAKYLEEINNTTENQNLNSRQKSSAKKGEKAQPTNIDVKTYFQENNFPEHEAQKFYNYFNSIGWLVGGKTPMVNWQAAAQNWMINADKYISNAAQTNRAKNLNTTTDKNYSEPL